MQHDPIITNRLVGEFTAPSLELMLIVTTNVGLSFRVKRRPIDALDVTQTMDGNTCPIFQECSFPGFGDSPSAAFMLVQECHVPTNLLILAITVERDLRNITDGSWPETGNKAGVSE